MKHTLALFVCNASNYPLLVICVHTRMQNDNYFLLVVGFVVPTEQRSYVMYIIFNSFLQFIKDILWLKAECKQTIIALSQYWHCSLFSSTYFTILIRLMLLSKNAKRFDTAYSQLKLFSYGVCQNSGHRSLQWKRIYRLQDCPQLQSGDFIRMSPDISPYEINFS